MSLPVRYVLYNCRAMDGCRQLSNGVQLSCDWLKSINPCACQTGRSGERDDASRGTGRKVYCALTWPDRWMDGMGARVIEDWKLGVYKYMLYLGSLNQLRSQASAESDLLCPVNVCLMDLGGITLTDRVDSNLLYRVQFIILSPSNWSSFAEMSTRPMF
jgi:hypothetical protein